MRHGYLFSLLLIMTCESSLFAQDPVVQPTVERNKYNFTQFTNETWSFVKQPTNWDGRDWLKLGLVGAGAFVVMEAVDQPIRVAVLKDQQYYYSVPIVGGRVWGELYMPVALFSGFAIHSIITGDMATRKIAYEVGQASLYAGGLTYIMKLVIGRARPYTNEGKSSFHPFGTISFKNDYQSFPGGHTTAGMVLSTVLSRNAKSDWLKGLAYVPVAFTFISRVYQDKHWTSDDFLGAALGYFVATWVVDHHEEEDSRVHVSSIFPFSVSIALD